MITADDESGIADISSKRLLELAKEWGAIIVAAHVTESRGLLKVLSGQPRSELWCNEDLTAVALSKKFENLDPAFAEILNGKVKEYKRDHLPAVIYAADVNAAKDVSKKPSWTYLKLSNMTLDGLRHAFLDPDSRVRLPESDVATPIVHISSISWTGGFLGGVTIPLNESLNVLIGPRGAGKSTVLESIRYVLDLEPLGINARRAYEGFIEYVLGSGTTVILEVNDPESASHWIIERSVPGETIVKRDGIATTVDPDSIIGRVEFFGQHEVAEFARMAEARSRLLSRFVPTSTTSKRTGKQIHDDLQANREEILTSQELQKSLFDGLERLPVVKDQLSKYDKAGSRKRLKAEAQFEQEQPIFSDVANLINDLEEEVENLTEIELSFLSDELIQDAPSKDGLTKIRVALDELRNLRIKSKESESKKLKEVQAVDESVKTDRDGIRSGQRDAYLETLRTLKTENVDGARIIELEKEKAELESAAKKLDAEKKQHSKLLVKRSKLLKEWEDHKRRQFESLKVAAQKVTKDLKPTVRVTCVYEGERGKLIEFLRQEISGQLDNVVKAIGSADNTFSPVAFANACRAGGKELSDLLGTKGAQVEKLCTLSDSALMEIEELWLAPTTEIELRVGQSEDGKPIWRGLERLSTGEKATAILLILLLGSGDSIPLIIDQAEDDLDNSFIVDDIVTKLRAEKIGRQFILTTHNPNIPVLGDAEQVIRLTPEGEASSGGRGTVIAEHVGSLDKKTVRVAVEALEGGREAFETRRRRYGY